MATKRISHRKTFFSVACIFFLVIIGGQGLARGDFKPAVKTNKIPVNPGPITTGAPKPVNPGPIAPAALTFFNIQPAGPTSLNLRQEAAIRWDYNAPNMPAGFQVKIELLRNGSLVGLIAQNVPVQLKQKSWWAGCYGPSGCVNSNTIASPGSGYTIRVSAMTGNVSAVSTTPFTLNSEPPFSVMAPSGDLIPGQEVRIVWKIKEGQIPDPASVKIKLELMKNNTPVGTIVSNEFLSNPFLLWSVGKYQGGQASVGNGYRIRMSTVDGSQSAEGQVINIKSPPASPNVSITDVHPVGPQSYTLGQNVNISWKYSGPQISPDLPVRVELLKDGTGYGVLIDSVKVSIGSFPWHAGNFTGGLAEAGGNYAIRVCTLDGKKCGKSATPFYLSPGLPLEVKGPTGDLAMGQEVNILWGFDIAKFPNPAGEKVKLMLWKDSLGKSIAENLPLTPSYFKWKAGEWNMGGSQGVVEPGSGYRIGIHSMNGQYSHKGPLLRIKGKLVSAQGSGQGMQAAAEAMNTIEVRHPQNGAACRLNDTCSLLWKRNTVRTSKVNIQLWQGDQLRTGWGNVQNTGKHVWEIGKGQANLVGENYFYIITSSNGKQKGKSGTFRIDHYSQIHTLGFSPKPPATTFSVVTWRHREDINADSGVCQDWSGHKPMIVQRLWWKINNDNFGGCCNYGWAYFDVKPNAVPVDKIRKATLTFRNHFLSSAFTGGNCNPQEVGDWVVVALSGMRDWNAPGEVLAHPQTEQVALDVTQMIKQWIKGERQNFGFLFRPVAPVGGMQEKKWECLSRNGDHIRFAIENPKLSLEYEEYY